MLKRLLTTIAVVLLMTLGVPAPAHAVAYDFAVDMTASANTTTVPSVITWMITVSSIGDAMGSGAAQEGYVGFTAPATISLVISDDCDTSGNTVSCYWLVEDSVDATFEVHGLVALTAVGEISVTATLTSNSPRADSTLANDSDTAVCTAVTSALVTC